MNYKSKCALDVTYDVHRCKATFFLFSATSKLFFDFERLEHSNYFKKCTIYAKLSNRMGMIYLLDSEFVAKHSKSVSE